MGQTAPIQTADDSETLTHAEENARAWAELIEAACEAVEFCDEEGEGRFLSVDAKRFLREHGYDGTNHAVVAELICQEMRESALSVEIRSGWREPGDGASMEPEEFRVLLSTGGPALRVWGELNRGEPSRCCWLEHQDWGTPWQRWRTIDRDALLWFAGLFWFGEV